MKIIVILTNVFLFFNTASASFNPVGKQSCFQSGVEGIMISTNMDTIPLIKKAIDSSNVVVITKPDSLPLNGSIPPIVYRTSLKKQVYNILYILPFNSHEASPSQFDINRNSVWAVDFYTGAQMAMLNYNDGPVLFNIYAIDSKTTDQDLISVLNRNEFKEADVIIGPYKNSQAKILTDYALANKTTLVSPYNSSSKPTNSNPNYIQLVPSLSVHYNKLAQGISGEESKELYVLTNGSENEKNRLVSLTNSLRTTKTKVKITEIILTNAQLKDNSYRLDSLITFEEGMQFFVPSTEDNLVGDILRKLDQSRKGTKIKTYGMPQWQNFNRALDYFSACGVRITSYYWLKTGNSDVMAFRNNYFNEYAKVPTTDTYLGYDMTKFVLEQLIKSGNYFQSNAQNVYYDGLVAKFHLEPISGQGTIPDFYENNNLHFIEFNGLGFRSISN